MTYYEKGSEETVIGKEELKEILFSTFGKLENRKKVLAVPPDITRIHSNAGQITQMAYQYYKERMTDILPAIGTHYPMTENEIKKMYGAIPKEIFRIHKWRSDLKTLGEVPGEFVEKVSGGKVNYSWPAQVNKLIIDGDFELILSVGQVVPHEVVGMANYNKNIFVGTGGQEGINKSHFLGAAYGMEKMMGRADTPVRKVLNYASENFAGNLPIVYILTVIGKDEDGKLVMRGIYIGDDEECFIKAAALSIKVNFTLLDEPLKKVIVYLDPEEFKTTWLGNKSVYRTRMAIADSGELIIIAPGLKNFGEDEAIDKLIRKYGYLTTPEILELVEKNEDLRNNLSAAAHLIHGSSEERFKITYAPGHLTEEEIRKANYNYAPLEKMLKKYDPAKLKDGFNLVDGEEIFYVSNPALGLWSTKDKFE